MNKHVIYGLFDPETQELRYIGYTSNIDKRYKDHHSSCYLRKNNHKNAWIKSLLSKNKKAEMIILEEHQTAEELPQAEIELIEYYKSIGCDLVNGTIGGDGISKGMKFSEETKLKMRKPKSEQHKKNMSEAQKGKPKSEEHKLKNSLGHIGKPNARKGTKCSDETKKKISDAMKKLRSK